MPTSYWLTSGNNACGFNGYGVQFAPTGTLSVSLVVTDAGFDPDKSFPVLVTFGSPFVYTVDGISVSSASDTCLLSLKSGDSVVLGNLPIGVSYSVTETIPQADIDLGYRVGSITGGTGVVVDGVAYSTSIINRYAVPETGDIWFYTNVQTSSVKFTANFYESDGTTPWTTSYIVLPNLGRNTGDTVSDISSNHYLRISNKDLGTRVVSFIGVTPDGMRMIYLYEYQGGLNFLRASGGKISLRLVGTELYYGTLHLTGQLRISSYQV